MKIFVSYRSTDRAKVQELVNDLADIGYEVWHDQELEGGQKWWDNILENIRQSDVLLFALTPNSLESYPCQLEYTYANNLKKHIIPIVMSEGVDLALLPVILQERQIVPYLKRDKEEFKSLTNALRKLPATPSLPRPLPDSPKLPISPLATIKTKIDATELSYEEQIVLFDQLKSFLHNQEYAKNAHELLTRLSQHPTLRASVFRDIQQALSVAPTSFTKNKPQSKSSETAPSKKSKESHGIHLSSEEEFINKVEEVRLLNRIGQDDTLGTLLLTNQRLVFRHKNGQMMSIDLPDISKFERKIRNFLAPCVDIKTHSGALYSFYAGTQLVFGGTQEGQDAIFALLETGTKLNK